MRGNPSAAGGNIMTVIGVAAAMVMTGMVVMVGLSEGISHDPLPLPSNGTGGHVPAALTCPTHDACDDGITCTSDVCNNGVCYHYPIESACTVPPGQPCILDVRCAPYNVSADPVTGCVVDHVAPDGTACGVSAQCCSGDCVSIDTHDGHCGACGQPCSNEDTCESGECCVNALGGRCAFSDDGSDATPCCPSLGGGVSCARNAANTSSWACCKADGQACALSTDCCEGHCDGTNVCAAAPAPCQPNGRPCSAGGECCTNFCNTTDMCDDHPSPCKLSGLACTSTSQCCAPLLCNASHLCSEGQVLCKADGLACAASTECCNDYCDATHVCAAPPPTPIPLVNLTCNQDSECAHNDPCVVGACVGGACTATLVSCVDQSPYDCDPNNMCSTCTCSRTSPGTCDVSYVTCPQPDNTCGLQSVCLTETGCDVAMAPTCDTCQQCGFDINDNAVCVADTDKNGAGCGVCKACSNGNCIPDSTAVGKTCGTCNLGICHTDGTCKTTLPRCGACQVYHTDLCECLSTCDNHTQACIGGVCQPIHRTTDVDGSGAAGSSCSANHHCLSSLRCCDNTCAIACGLTAVHTGDSLSDFATAGAAAAGLMGVPAPGNGDEALCPLPNGGCGFNATTPMAPVALPNADRTARTYVCSTAATRGSVDCYDV